MNANWLRLFERFSGAVRPFALLAVVAPLLLVACSSSSGSGGGGQGGDPTSSSSAASSSSSGGSASCPAQGLGDDALFCEASACGEAAGVDPTPTSNECTGSCTDGRATDATCHNGNWSCARGGHPVGSCTTSDCTESCCFPTGCPSAGSDGKGQSNQDGSCTFSTKCKTKSVDIACDAQGNCTCKVDGSQVASCRTGGLVNDPCSADLGCCAAYLLSC